MKKKAFTLLEMLMVIFIIALLLLLTIPNIAKHKVKIEETTCKSYVNMVNTQITAYEITEDQKVSSLDQLKSKGYIPSKECSNGKGITIVKGKAQLA